MEFLNLYYNNNIQDEFRWSYENDIYTFDGFPVGSELSIIIGQNNSRKSRFFRHLLKQKEYFTSKERCFYLMKKIEEAFQQFELNSKKNDYFDISYGTQSERVIKRIGDDGIPLINYIKAGISGNLTSYNIKYFKRTNNAIKTAFEKRDKKSTNEAMANVSSAIIVLDALFNYKTIIDSHPEIKQKFAIKLNNRLYHYDNMQFDEKLIPYFELLKTFAGLEFNLLTPPKVYIPTLRGTTTLKYRETGKEELEEINESVYSETIRINYELDETINVFTGLDLYTQIKKVRNSVKEIRKNFDAFESFLSSNFFDNREVDIVALEGKRIIQVYIKDEKDRPLYHLGDGIQSLITLVYPIFTAEDKSWVYIEEPEINMHPGLQSLFLKTVLTNEFIKSKQLKIFVTTHSNHLLNSLSINSNKCSIFSFEKIINAKEDFTLVREEINPNTDVLDLLGVTNNSVLLANCTVWVEGITDRLILSAFLKAYIEANDVQEYVENYHYSFFEYAGSNLAHYLFEEDMGKSESEKIDSFFLSNRIFLLTDQDENKEAKHSKFKALENKSFWYQTTEAREIENVSSVKIMKLILSQLLPIDRAKVDAMRFKEEDYFEIKMGSFIKKKTANKLKKEVSLLDKYDTIKTYYKNKFAELVADNVSTGKITWEMISKNEAAKNLTERLYSFIKEQNKYDV